MSHHVAVPDVLPGYGLPWHSLRTLYQSRGLQAVYDCLYAGAGGMAHKGYASGINGYVAMAAHHGMRGLIDTDAHMARMAAQVSTSNADAMRAVFTALCEACLDNSLLAVFTLHAARTGKDRRSGMPPDVAQAMTFLVRSRLGQSRQGMPEATWLSYVVTSVAALCWQALRRYGDAGIADTAVYAAFHAEETARDMAHKRNARDWHRLQDSQPAIRQLPRTVKWRKH